MLKIICCLLVSLTAVCAQPKRKVRIKVETPQFLQPEELHYDSKHGKLIFPDQYGKKFCIYYPNSRKTACTSKDQRVGKIVPLAGSEDQYVAGIGRSLVILKWDGLSPHSMHSVLQSVEPDKSDNFFNDGNVDSKGRLWIGTEGNRGPERELIPNQANLYHFSEDNCSLEKDLGRVTASGSIAWNFDETIMYYVDSGTNRVDKFDYDGETGEICNRRPVFDLRENQIDGLLAGLTIDTNENLWLACFGDPQIIHVNPNNGRIIKSLKLRFSDVASITWGGPDLDILYAATSRARLNETEMAQQPRAGSVLAITGLGARGRPANDAVICRRPKDHSGGSWREEAERPPQSTIRKGAGRRNQREHNASQVYGKRAAKVSQRE